MLAYRTADERFWSKVDLNGPIPEACPELGRCWVWTATRGKTGYGMFYVGGGARMRAHRYAWISDNGPVPDGLLILHHCDNRACVRLKHLRTGTNDDNMRDMVIRKRAKPGSALYPERMPRGEQHPNARLNEQQVREIREAKAAGQSDVQIARKYGVYPNCIYMIVRRKAWKHIA